MLKYSDFITIYFTEERIESLFFIIIGVITLLLAAIFLLIIKYSFFKGMAISLLLIGILQVTVGFNIYDKTQNDTIRVQNFANYRSNKIETVEIPRIKKVIHDLAIYKWVYIILIILGIIVWNIFKRSSQIFWKGLALGIIIQATIMLSLELLAEKRAKNYLIELQRTC